MRAALERASDHLRASGMTVLVAIDSDLPAVSASPDDVERALGNLLLNAAQHAAGGATVRVGAHQCAARWVQIFVEDRGPGLSVRERRTMLEPFARGSEAVRRGVRGSGLGLYLVRECVERWGGAVRLRDAHPTGCRFELDFPIAEASAEVDV